MNTKTVYCKVCGKKLAWWSMFDNIQYEDEWECLGKYRKKLIDNWKHKEDGVWISTRRKNNLPGEVPVKSEMRLCSLDRHTKYCTICVRKINFKCVGHKCKGQIRLVRREDGSETKYSHGGW